MSTLGTEDLFTPIHKALRTMLYGLSSRLQTNDFTDRDATQRLAQDLERDFAAARSAGCTLCVMATHAQDEDQFIFPRSAAFANALVTSLIAEHHDLTRQELDIERAARELAALDSPDERVGAGVRLNQAVNTLLVAYLAHMNREERELVPVLQQHLTNPEMLAMRGAIVGRLPPERLLLILGWLLPSLNVQELTAFVGGLLRTAPPPVVKAVTELGGAKVDPARWALVRERIGA